MKKFKKVGSLFDKKVNIENNHRFFLPDKVYVCNKWSISSFQSQKEELNRTKSLLNEFNLEEWSRHTKHRDPSSFIIRFVKQKFQPELVTQAWCKFYEILNHYPIISKEAISLGSFSSLHLCEAPGAFICALNHYIKSNDLNIQWVWFANSLNPDYEGNSLQEMIPDDRFLKQTYQNWYFGADCTGNITKYYNHLEFLGQIPKVWLVTADGSIDCSHDPGNQEVHVSYLHYCETISALALLLTGGTFVLKIFTSFEDSTICLLYLLATVFHKLSVFKPASSKGGNSEVYIICLDYKGKEFLVKIWNDLLIPYKNSHFDSSKSMFNLDEIDQDFISQLSTLSKYFMKKQIERINDNIAHFKNESKLQSDLSKIHQIKIYVANRYIHKYRLKTIPKQQRIVTEMDVSRFFINDLKKFDFHNRVVKIDVRNLICSESTFSIKLGLRIEQIKSSRFCKSEFYNKFGCSAKNVSSLYQFIKNRISENATVISIEDCNFNAYFELQSYIFYKIYNSCNLNFIFYKVPLITNFLVGLVFILISMYDFVYVHQNGCLVLCNPSNSLDLRKILNCVDSAFKDSNNKKFPSDVIQIFPPSTFYSNKYFEFIYNYNNIVLSKI